MHHCTWTETIARQYTSAHINTHRLTSTRISIYTRAYKHTDQCAPAHNSTRDAFINNNYIHMILHMNATCNKSMFVHIQKKTGMLSRAPRMHHISTQANEISSRIYELVHKQTTDYSESIRLIHRRTQEHWECSSGSTRAFKAHKTLDRLTLETPEHSECTK